MDAFSILKFKQVAQLSQRDRAAGWLSYGQKWKTGTAWETKFCGHYLCVYLQALNVIAQRSNRVR